MRNDNDSGGPEQVPTTVFLMIEPLANLRHHRGHQRQILGLEPACRYSTMN